MLKKAVSCGGIVTKKENGQIKICLIKLTHLLKGCVFPKGHVEGDELLEATALREVKEETGLQDLSIIKKLGVVTRKATERDGTEVMKDIHIYLFKSSNYVQKESDEEYGWFTFEEAMTELMAKEEQEFLKFHWAEINANI